MTSPPLGRLERVALREVRTNEATAFTPWLAQPENLAVLAETLGIDLQLEAQEKAVGPFRADILCKDANEDSWVLIENQIEPTDHRHLGQLLTYAAGLQAVTLVWIAERFTEEHRATLDWLNKITGESFSFFGLEVELWRIAGSPPAPKFNIVAKPNDWSRSVAEAARAIDDADLSETRAMQRRYWESFLRVLSAVGGPISGRRKPQPDSWMDFPIGRSGFHLAAVMIRPKGQVRVELYIAGSKAKALLNLLMREEFEIEREFGDSLEWEDLPTRRDCRVALYLRNTDPDDEADWPRQHEWLAMHLNALHRVFAERVRVLDADVAEAEKL